MDDSTTNSNTEAQEGSEATNSESSASNEVPESDREMMDFLDSLDDADADETKLDTETEENANAESKTEGQSEDKLPSDSKEEKPQTESKPEEQQTQTEAPAAETTAPAQTQQPAQTDAQTQTQVPASPAAAQSPTQPQQQPQQQPPPQPQPQQQPVAPTAEALAAEQQAQLEALQAQFALSEEDENEFLTDPGKAVPKFAARFYTTILESVGGALRDFIPAQIQQVQQQQSKSQEAESAFFEYWDKRGADLRPHRESLETVAKVYRTVNPSADMETAIRDIGGQIILHNQIELKQPGQVAQQTAAVAAAQPNAPAQQTVAATRPFTPAATDTGGSGITLAKQTSGPTGFAKIDHELFEVEDAYDD